MDYRDPKASVEAGEERQRENERAAAAERKDLEQSVTGVTTPPRTVLARAAWALLVCLVVGLLYWGCVALVVRH